MAKKLQIVRVDNDLVQKANLLIGNNIISRGAATGVSKSIFFTKILYQNAKCRFEGTKNLGQIIL